MLKKTLFACSLICWAIGLIEPGTASQWGAGLPLGAVLLFLSFIVMLLEKEAALYDAEHPHDSTATDVPQPSKTPVKGISILNKHAVH